MERPGYNCAKELVTSLLEIDNALPEEEKLDPKLLECWIDEIVEFADVVAVEYLTGKRSEEKMTDEEMKLLYEKATYRLAQQILDGLVDKNLVEVSVNDEGDLLYGLTDEGRKAVTDNTQKFK